MEANLSGPSRSWWEASVCLSERWLEAAGRLVRIPMPGAQIDSLNAAASAAILLFEAVRQRSL